MSLHGYSDHEYEADDDQPTLISKIDLSSPLHLHPNDSATFTIIFVKLKGTENYRVRFNTDEVSGRQWDRVNAVVLGWILNSIFEELFLGQIFSKRAKHVWDELKETYDKVDGSVTFNLHHKINFLSQNSSSIADYYHSNILSRDELPDVRSAYAIISIEGLFLVLVLELLRDPSLLPYNVTIHVNSGNRSPSGGSPLVCENCGFNGHTMDSSIDISYLGIKVSHHNGIKALIIKVGNLKLTKFLTTYDVLVVPEYSVTLVSVHKVARDSKFIGGFDESKCFLMSQDLMDVKILEIGRQINGLYYFDNVEGHMLRFGNFSNNSKINWHNRLGHHSDQLNRLENLFPLSEHKFTGLGELVHLDLWGPYRVVSKEGHSFCESEGGIPLNLWSECILPSSVLKGKSPYEPVFNKKPSLKHLRVIGCLCFATILNNHDKFSSRAEKCVLGSNGSATESERAATSDHNTTLFEDDVVVDDTTEHVQVLNNQPLRRFERASVFPNKYNEYVVDSKVKYGLENFVGYSNLTSEFFCFTTELNKAFKPKNYWEACKDQHWIEAMNKEMNALYRNDTWEFCDLPKDRKYISRKWVFIIKYKSNGEIERYKPRYVVKGYNQKESIDFDETFSPVVKIVTVRCLINIDVQNN
ncbi:ribonuclease H-like domain-containing protein [Tanacetum coccineum]